MSFNHAVSSLIMPDTHGYGDLSISALEENDTICRRRSQLRPTVGRVGLRLRCTDDVLTSLYHREVLLNAFVSFCITAATKMTTHDT